MVQYKTYAGIRCQAPCILNLVTRWEWKVLLTFLLPWHSEKDHLVLNGSKVLGTLGWSEHVAERKILIQPITIYLWTIDFPWHTVYLNHMHWPLLCLFSVQDWWQNQPAWSLSTTTTTTTVCFNKKSDIVPVKYGGRRCPFKYNLRSVKIHLWASSFWFTAVNFILFSTYKIIIKSSFIIVTNITDKPNTICTLFYRVYL